MIGLFWELRQQSQIRDAQASTSLMNARAANTQNLVSDLAERVDKLSLVCMAMWTLLQEKTNLSEQDLIDRVEQIDMQDGKDDDKLTRPAPQCPECNRPMSLEHKKCLYCGAVLIPATAFQAM